MAGIVTGPAPSRCRWSTCRWGFVASVATTPDDRLHMLHSLSGISWPASLQDIRVDAGFNQPIFGITWPPSLTYLNLGVDFDQPIAAVNWPSSLRTLYLLG